MQEVGKQQKLPITATTDFSNQRLGWSGMISHAKAHHMMALQSQSSSANGRNELELHKKLHELQAQNRGNSLSAISRFFVADSSLCEPLWSPVFAGGKLPMLSHDGVLRFSLHWWEIQYFFCDGRPNYPKNK